MFQLKKIIFELQQEIIRTRQLLASFEVYLNLVLKQLDNQMRRPH